MFNFIEDILEEVMILFPSEIIHIGQIVMSHKASNDLKYFVNTTFNYPTMAEAYRVAALNGLNRLF